MTTKVKAASAGEFLALVPALVGCQPTESVVIVLFGGTSSLGAMRIDLPVDESRAAQMATTATGLVCRVDGATGLALVVYGDPACAERVDRELTASAQAAGLSVVDSLVVHDGHWSRIAEPGDVHPLEPVPGTFSGMARDGDQHSGAELPALDGELAAEVARLMQEGSVDLSPDDLLPLFELAVRMEPFSTDAAGYARLAWCLARPALRDVALVQWTRGIEWGAEALEAQLAWESGTDYPTELASVMWGEGARPDSRRLERALSTCLQTAVLAPIEQRPGALAAAAWLSWALGRSTHASAHARHARDIDSEHGLAGIVLSMVDAGHLPGS